MKKKTKNIIIVLSIVVTVLIIAVIGIASLIRNMNEGLKELDNIVISNVDLSELSDGDYYGSYSAGIVSAEVKVTVLSNNITEIIIIKHNHGRGADAETLPQTVIQEQSVEVDYVAGATYSSKVILKAIENALRGEPQDG